MTTDDVKVGGQEPTSYNEWIKVEAAKVNSDGCTVVSEWHHECCLEHDLACRYDKDPRSAYECYLKGLNMHGKDDCWYWAKPLSRRDADKRFWKCNRQNTSAFGKFRADLRYLGVRLGALTFWR